MAFDVDAHATALLEFLYDSPDNTVFSYLNVNRLDDDAGRMLVTFLSNRGLVQDLGSMESADAKINAEGVAVVQQLRAERMTPARRRGTLRSRMLTWLDKPDQRGEATDWSGFLASPHMSYHGNDFTESEVYREAGYLKEKGLITSEKVWNAPGGMRRPTITTEGQDCLVDFGGNVSDYLNRGQRPNTTTNNIHMTGSNGNITVASDNVVQNVNVGLDTTEVLKFAGFVRQSLPVLGVEGNTRGELDTRAEELHQEASSAAPDRGKLRRLLDAILDGLRSAAPTVIQTTAIGMGEEALKAITGS